MIEMEFAKTATELGVKPTPENLEFILYCQESYDRQLKEHEDHYSKLEELHYVHIGRLPYSPYSDNYKWLNCLRLDYMEYQHGVINFFQLLKCLWFHAWEIKQKGMDKG